MYCLVKVKNSDAELGVKTLLVDDNISVCQESTCFTNITYSQQWRFLRMMNQIFHVNRYSVVYTVPRTRFW